MQDLKGRVAVVTGAASGIGLAMARQFATDGMKLVLADIEETRLAQALEQVRTLGAEAITQRGQIAHAKFEIARGAVLGEIAAKRGLASAAHPVALVRRLGFDGERARTAHHVIARLEVDVIGNQANRLASGYRLNHARLK